MISTHRLTTNTSTLDIANLPIIHYRDCRQQHISTTTYQQHMDELTLARREFEFDQREFTLTKQQFYSEQKQHTQQVQLDKQQFEIAKQQFDIAKQQFYSEQQQLKQQFEVSKQQFELEKITFQHEIQQQRDLLTQQKKQLAIDQQQHLQSYLIPSSNNCDLGLLSESVQNEEQSQQMLSQHLIPSPPPPSLVTNLLEGMINKSNNHLNHEIEHYYQLTKQLHSAVNQLKKKEKKIKQRDMKSKQCLRRNYRARHHLACYSKFIKSRHDMIIKPMEWDTKLEDDNNSLKTIEESDTRLNKDKVIGDHHQDNNNKFKLDTTPLYEKQIIFNTDAWELRSKQNELKYLNAVKKYNEKKVGKKPEIDEVQARVMFKLINLNKDGRFDCNHSYSNHPLLSSLYKTPKATALPIFDHFFKKDSDNGTIPKLTDDLKLFFSSQHIDNGRWIQFHGPGKEVDGNTRDNPVTLFSLLNPNDLGTFQSTSDHDRCELSKDECTKQHKETDKNYTFYHSSPLTICTARHQISIKWE